MPIYHGALCHFCGSLSSGNHMYRCKKIRDIVTVLVKHQAAQLNIDSKLKKHPLHLTNDIMINTLIGLDYWCVWKCYSRGVSENFIDMDKELKIEYNREVKGWGLKQKMINIVSKKKQEKYKKKVGKGVNSSDKNKDKNRRLEVRLDDKSSLKSSLYYIEYVILKQLQIFF